MEDFMRKSIPKQYSSINPLFSCFFFGPDQVGQQISLFHQYNRSVHRGQLSPFVKQYKFTLPKALRNLSDSKAFPVSTKAF